MHVVKSRGAGWLWTAGFIGMVLAVGGARSEAQRGGVITSYTDPRQQTALWFGARSHWLQPWRAYLDTVPTARLREAVGINLNVGPEQADAVCRHLARNGFRKVRVEFGWGSVSWDDPHKLADPARFAAIVGACKRHGLRPLFLLNAHHGAPCPTRFFDVHLTLPAHKGDRTVHLDRQDLASLVPGRSGLSRLTDYWAAEVLFTRIDPDGTATLSRPLPKDLPAGKAPAATLKYLPFYPAKLKTGGVPPEFTETLAGWRDYMQAITTAAKQVLGTEGARDAGFDLEVWNELTFGSKFLSINNYYETPMAEGDRALEAILANTVAYVNDPAHRLPGVGIDDGFDNQWPWGAGSTAPPGLTALGKHPYAGARHFPRDQGQPNGIRPVDALGNPDGVQLGPDRWQDTFVPTYLSFFPEYPLCALQTEHLIRDLSPIATDLYGVKHGRTTHPVFPDGRPAPPPQMWITEVNLDPQGADPGDETAYTAGMHPPVAPQFTRADADHLKAKAVLRYLVSYVNKGVARLYFFAARDDNPQGLGLISQAFFDALRTHNNAAPADEAALTSPTLQAVRRLVAAMPGGENLTHPRRLSLERIAETHGHLQFAGDPKTAGQTPNPHPPLYNRDVLGFFPFQATDTRFVVGLYVMTRNLSRVYRPEAPTGDVTRYDMPDEHYQLTIGGVRGAYAHISLYDPLHDTSLPVHIQHAGPDTLTVDVPLTDSPRLLTIEERGNRF